MGTIVPILVVPVPSTMAAMAASTIAGMAMDRKDWAALLRLVLILGLGAASTCARALEVECEPARPFFCMNIHAGCAGRTEVATFPFKLKADAGRGWIESASDASDMRQLYENGRAEWEAGETRVIVRPDRGQGYIRLLADGRYVFRYYRGDVGIMSYGHCR